MPPRDMPPVGEWYLKIDDLHGGSEEYGYQHWFDVASWDFVTGFGKTLPGRRAEVWFHMVTGPARAVLVSAMQSRRKFIQAKVQGDKPRMAAAYMPFTELRVLKITPNGHHRNQKPLDMVGFEINSPG